MAGRMRPPTAPPPDWCLTPQFKEERIDNARLKFQTYIAVRAGAFREVPSQAVYEALKLDGGVPGVMMSQLVPEIPWERLIPINAPEKGCSSVSLSVFFSAGKKLKLRVLELPLWKEFSAHGSDGFGVFKVEEIRGAADRLFCIVRTASVLTGLSCGRIVIPQPNGDHLLIMQLNDYMSMH